MDSYSCELGYNVPNKIKLQISNGQYVNLAKLRPNASDPDNETQFLSVRDGSLAMASKPKAKLVNDIQTWKDLFLIYSSIYAAAHPECTTALLKYIHTVRLGASRSLGLGWCDYDVQFRLKKEQNPNMSFAMVDQELWLLYMQAPLLAPKNNPEQIGKCYDFNNRGVCQRRPCPYKHQCLRCSLNHPSTKCQLVKPPTITILLPGQTYNSHRAESSHHQPPTPQNQSSHLDVNKIASTPINVSQLQNYLQFYPDQNIAAELIHGFSQGFYLSYDGPRHATDCRNLKSLLGFENVAIELITKEINLGRVAGPFTTSPLPYLRLSPIGLVPKKRWFI